MRLSLAFLLISFCLQAQADYWIKKATLAGGKGLYDSVEWYFQNAEASARQKNDQSNVAFIQIYRAKNMHDRGDYEDAIYLAGKVINESESWAGPFSYYQGMASEVIGKCELKRGNYEEAIKQFFDAELTFRKNENWLLMLGSVLLSTGNAFLEKGSVAQSIEYFNRAKACFDKKNDAINSSIAQLSVAGALVKQEKYDEAIAIFTQNTDRLKQMIGENHPAMAPLYNNTGVAVFYQGKDYPLALLYFNKSHEMKLKQLGENHIDVARDYFNMGWAHAEMKSWATAETEFTKAETILQKLFPFGHPLAVWTYNQHAFMTMKQKKFERAIELLDKADVQNSHRSGQGKIYFDKVRAVETFKFKSQAYFQWYKASKKLEHLKSSLQFLLDAEMLMQQAHQQIQKEDDRIELGKIGRSLCEMGAEVSHELHFATKDEEYLNTYFHFAEGGKAVVLNQALAETQALKFAGVPDSVIAKDRVNRESEAYFTQQLLSFDPSKQPEEDRAKLEDVLFKVSAIKKMFLENLAEEYPKYFELKYKTSSLNLKQLQGSLPPGRAIISYLQTDSILFVNTIMGTSNSLSVTKVKPAELERLVLAMRTGILFQTKEVYAQAAHRLYQKLFPNGLAADIKEIIIIIPDNRLVKIPFEALLTKAPTSTTTFDQFDFLLKRVTVSYANSAELYYQGLQSSKPKAKLGLLAIAPVFEKGKGTAVNLRTRSWLNENNKVIQADKQTRGSLFNGDDIAPLPATADEVNNLYTLFDTNKETAQAVLGPIANERTLKQAKLYDYRYIHIATHGFVNEESPELSGLLLAQDTTDQWEDNILYMGEIFNLNLNADLVTLSACETGLGKIVEGEGVVGLTRAFTYAGAKNILVSLWKVNDASTAELMKSFYAILLKNPSQSISSALQQSKLMMIKDKKFADPYYWSPFVLLGR